MLDLSRFVRELRRRSLWQVLGVYLAASWVAIEIASTLTESFGLPEWFPAFALALLVLGLPMMIATTLLSGESPSDLPAGEDVPESSGARRLLTWRNTILGGVGALALWGVVAAGWLLFRPGAGLPGSGVERASIAVLPLENLSREAAEDYVADGLHDEIITQLQKLGGLKVTSRTSVLAFRDDRPNVREIGRELGVGAILEGSLRVQGQRVRVIAQLIDARTDEHIWAEDYDRTLTTQGLFSIQQDIARAIARELRTRLTDEERSRIDGISTSSMAAYRHYIRGRQSLEQWTPDGVRVAIERFELALEEDSEFALAYAGLAEAYAVGVTEAHIPRWEEILNAERAANRAIELDPDLGEAYAARAMVRSWAAWDWDAADRDFTRAMELNPGDSDLLHWYAHHLFTVGRTDEALDVSRRATVLDPLSPAMHLQYAWNLFFAGRHAEAHAGLDRVLDVDPAYVVADIVRSWIHMAQGRIDEALMARERFVGAGLPEYYIEGCAAARAGDVGRAHEVSARAEEDIAQGRAAPWTRYDLAGVHACLGNRDEAFEWMEQARVNRDAMMIMIPTAPRFQALHGDERWGALLERMGL